jgi:hypothetical protein
LCGMNRIIPVMLTGALTVCLRGLLEIAYKMGVDIVHYTREIRECSYMRAVQREAFEKRAAAFRES